MPVLPDVESRIVFPGTSAPRASPSSTILSAGRSLTEPPGLNPSSLPKMRTPGASPSRTLRSSTSGVLPTSWSADGTVSGPVAGDVGRASAARAVDIRGLPPPGDRGYDRELVTGLERGVEVLQEADVLAVHEDVHEPPHLPVLVTDALLEPGVAALEVVDQRGDRPPVGLDSAGAARVLAERRRNLDLNHDDPSSFQLPATLAVRCPLSRV